MAVESNIIPFKGNQQIVLFVVHCKTFYLRQVVLMSGAAVAIVTTRFITPTIATSYFVVYFNHVTAFDALYHCCGRGSFSLCRMQCMQMGPTLNTSSAIQHFERGDVIEIQNGMIFDFYPGLPHMKKFHKTYSQAVTQLPLLAERKETEIWLYTTHWTYVT